MTYWLLIIGIIGLIGSAWASGMETGLYRLNRVRLGVKASKRNRLALALQALLDRPTTMVATLMVINNMMNYLTTTALDSALAQHVGDHPTSALIGTIIITSTLFIFAETLPKDFFANMADKLVYKLGWPLIWLRYLLYPLVVIVATFGKIALKLSGIPGERPMQGRERLRFLVQESVGYGVLSEAQSHLATRVMSLNQMPVQQAMVPWGQVVSIRSDQPIKTLRKRVRTLRYWHLPVLGNKNQPIGQLDVADALIALDTEQPDKLQDLLKPLPTVQANTLIRSVIETMRTHHSTLAVVCDTQQRPIGLVSLRDLIAPLLGNIRGI